MTIKVSATKRSYNERSIDEIVESLEPEVWNAITLTEKSRFQRISKHVLILEESEQDFKRILRDPNRTKEVVKTIINSYKTVKSMEENPREINAMTCVIILDDKVKEIQYEEKSPYKFTLIIPMNPSEK